MKLKTLMAAEQVFYQAFTEQDLKAMMQVWADHCPVFCIHPGGDLLSGREEIKTAWQQIFTAKVPFRFELEYHHQDKRSDQFGLIQVAETLFLQNHRVGTILATNGYCLVEDGWRMVLHHASPKPSLEAQEENFESSLLH